MKTTTHVSRTRPLSHRTAFLSLVVAGSCLMTTHASAQSTGFVLLKPTPGGIDSRPNITSITETQGQGLRIEWFGFEGPYQVERTGALNGSAWTNIGPSTSGNSVTVPKHGAAGFHRVKGGAPRYQGAGACADCHDSVHASWSKTPHANAYQTLKNVNQHNNPECIVCHAVGVGVPSGFISESATPQFANVQCESCHGPAGNHMDSGDPPALYPIVTRSSMLCGGCHNGFHHPTYDEWTSSPHSAVIQDLVADFTSTNRTTAVGRMSSCGACHSGAVRLEMVGAYNSRTGNARTNVAWPSGAEAVSTPVGCVVCHDVHQMHKYTNVLTGVVYTNSLRNPLTSTNFFSYNTGTNFASQYNPNVSICAQCHNARGATVTSSSRAPHYSPQYNIFMGSIGITATPAPPQGAHRTNPRQCAGCHTHGHGETNPTPGSPAYTGHAFRATVQACAVCHTDTTGAKSPTNLLFTTQSELSSMISTTKNLLDLWASTKNTNSWASKYEARGWEYTVPGDLSNPSHSPSITGPITAEQAQIPQGIKDARFNLYLVSQDKSLGIHNAPYTKYLLSVAQQRVNVELAK